MLKQWNNYWYFRLQVVIFLFIAIVIGPYYYGMFADRYIVKDNLTNIFGLWIAGVFSLFITLFVLICIIGLFLDPLDNIYKYIKGK